MSIEEVIFQAKSEEEQERRRIAQQSSILPEVSVIEASAKNPGVAPPAPKSKSQ